MYQHSTYTSPQTSTYSYGNNTGNNIPTTLPSASSVINMNNSGNNKPSSHDQLQHHSLARPTSMPPSYYQKYSGNNGPNDGYPTINNNNNNSNDANESASAATGGGPSFHSSKTTFPGLLNNERNNNNDNPYETHIPRTWQHQQHHDSSFPHSRDYSSNNNNDTDYLPTSSSTSTGVSTLSYPTSSSSSSSNNHNNNSTNIIYNTNNNNASNNSSNSSSYFAAPPPSTPVPPPVSAGNTAAPASVTSTSNMATGGSGGRGGRGGAYNSHNTDSGRQHLYHPYSANRRHSANSLGYGGNTGSSYSYGPAGLPSFSIHSSPRPPIIPRPKLTTTLWEDEGTICYQVDANGICVARRNDNDMINGTKLLNVAGMSRGKRDGILKNEKGRVVVKVGAMHLKGVWITFARAKTLATQYKIVDILHPLFVDNPSNFLYASPIHHTHHNHGAVAAAAAASMTGLTPAAPTTSTAGSRIDSGFSTTSEIATGSTTGGAFRQPLSHHHISSPPSLSSQQQVSSSHTFQPPQGLRSVGEYHPTNNNNNVNSSSSTSNTTGRSSDMYNFDYRGGTSSVNDSSAPIGGLVSGYSGGINNTNNLSGYHLYHQQGDQGPNRHVNSTGGVANP